MTPWTEWEDYNAGMWNTRPIDEAKVVLSVATLSDLGQFLETGREMIREWQTAAIHNIVSLKTGRRAWVGQASCCYSHKATSAETRQAWGQLANMEQRAANDIADIIIAEYNEGRTSAETLFGH